MEHLYSSTVLMIDESQGIYIPQQFANKYEEDPRWVGADQDDIAELLKGPEADGYWEAWEMVLNDARYLDKDGRKWQLWQDGDLFAYYDDGEQFT